MNLFRLLFYLQTALDCDVPIIEAVWIAGDRLMAEFTLLLPRLHFQLSAWDFVFKRKKLKWKYGVHGQLNYRSCAVTWGTMRGLGQITAWNNNTMKTFIFDVAFPTDTYKIWAEGTEEPQMLPSRNSWWFALRAFLKPPGFLLQSSPFYESHQLSIPGLPTKASGKPRDNFSIE